MPRWTPTEEPEAVAHLCPDIHAAMTIIRRHCPVGHPDRQKALEHLRAVKDGVHQLRHNAALLEKKSRS